MRGTAAPRPKRKSGAIRLVWNALPIDGRGLVAPADRDARYLIAFATNRRLARIPGVLRPAIVWALRLLWCLKATWLVAYASRKFGFPLRVAARCLLDAWFYGMRPKDSFAWRQGRSTLPPLSTQAFWKIALVVGTARQREILADKLATAAVLHRISVVTPKLLSVIPAGTQAPVLPDGIALFVKPSKGRRGINSFAVKRLAAGQYWIDGASHDAAYVSVRLRAAASGNAVLVQPLLTGVPELADLHTPAGSPPTLRIVTVCEKGGLPYVHAAYLLIAVPGESSHHPLRDALRAPIEIKSGRLLAAHWFGAPAERFEWSPWHYAAIAGRSLPGFSAAADAAVSAASAFPGLPLIGWDVILTGDGPVVLEGNVANDLLLIKIGEEGAPDAPQLLPLLRRWTA